MLPEKLNPFFRTDWEGWEHMLSLADAPRGIQIIINEYYGLRGCIVPICFHSQDPVACNMVFTFAGRGSEKPLNFTSVLAICLPDVGDAKALVKDGVERVNQKCIALGDWQYYYYFTDADGA
ncbi:hypothetical protein DFH09DRAFT_1331159 [Mycena vulgaris]|nr:hypothetical protein DFH09DRAFT_1331159 [Mycena vulgaris]